MGTRQRKGRGILGLTKFGRYISVVQTDDVSVYKYIMDALVIVSKIYYHSMD